MPQHLAAPALAGEKKLLLRLPCPACCLGSTKSSLPIDIWPFADVAASHIIPDVMPFKANKKHRICFSSSRRRIESLLLSIRPLHNKIAERVIKQYCRCIFFYQSQSFCCSSPKIHIYHGATVQDPWEIC